MVYKKVSFARNTTAFRVLSSCIKGRAFSFLLQKFRSSLKLFFFFWTCTKPTNRPTHTYIMTSTHIAGGMGSTPFAGGSTVSSTSSSTPIQQHAMAPGAAPPGPTPEALAVASEETRQDLELRLKELIECLLELSITVYDFQPESNSLVHQKM